MTINSFEKKAYNFLLLLTIILVIFYYASTQQQISYNNGIPYDAEHYFKIAEQIAQGEKIHSEKPFVYRIGLPFLVGKLFPNNIMYGYTVLNLFFGLLTIGVLFRYLSYYLKQDVIVKILVFAYVVNPNAPFRQVFYYPVQTDPAALFFMLTILFLCRKGKITLRGSIVLMFLGFIGTLFREIVIFSLLVQFISQIVSVGLSNWQLNKIFLASLPTLAGFTALLVTHSLVEVTGTYTFYGHALESFNRLLNNFSMYPLAWLISVGPSIIIAILLFNRKTLSFLVNNPQISFFITGIFFGSMVSGWHVDRFIFWSLPVTSVLIGHIVLSNMSVISYCRQLLIFIPLIVVHFLTHRVWLNIPNDTFGSIFNPGNPQTLLFAPYGENTNLAQTFAAYMTPESRHILIFQFFILAVYFFLVLKLPMLFFVHNQSSKK